MFFCFAKLVQTTYFVLQKSENTDSNYLWDLHPFYTSLSFYSSFNKIDKWKEQFHFLFVTMNCNFFFAKVYTQRELKQKTFKSCSLSLPLINVRLSVWMTRWSVRTQAQKAKGGKKMTEEMCLLASTTFLLYPRHRSIETIFRVSLLGYCE